MVDKLAPGLRSKIMSKIRSKDTKPEVVLRKSLYSKGIKYRLHVDALPGKPDIVIQRKKIAIFVDGDFWHGKDWENLQKRLSRGYWFNKIKKNMERDEKVNQSLEKEGWKVFRYWECNILSNVEEITKEILDAIDQ